MNRERWKRVERNVAATLNEVLSDVGKFTPMERIPLLGREGPDLTINETGLVINVKSRAEIPDRLYPISGQAHYIGPYTCFRLEELTTFSNLPCPASNQPWKRLADWWQLMDRWTKEFKPEGVTCIIIHRPRMPIGHAGVVVHHTDLWRLSCQIKTQSL